MRDGHHHEVVVITGASAGLGRAIAREFARNGAHLGLIARGEEGLESAQREMESFGARVLGISADVADAEAVEAAAERIENELGPIDVWINNAMTTVFGPFAKLSPDEFRRVTEVTYLGQVYGTMAALKRMRPRDRGTVVHVGSALAYRSIPLQTAYCGAKHAIKGFVEGLRCELMHEGSRVHLTMVQMPALNTPQFDWCRSYMFGRARPLAPIYQPEVGARAVYWAAHNRRRQLDVGFSSALTILGNKVVPGLMDRYITRTAVDGQQEAQAEQYGRADNLWRPVDSQAPGAHGRFDNESLDNSPQLWLSTHRGTVALAAGAAVLAGLALLARPLRNGGVQDSRGLDRPEREYGTAPPGGSRRTGASGFPQRGFNPR